MWSLNCQAFELKMQFYEVNSLGTAWLSSLHLTCYVCLIFPLKTNRHVRSLKVEHCCCPCAWTHTICMQFVWKNNLMSIHPLPSWSCTQKITNLWKFYSLTQTLCNLKLNNVMIKTTAFPEFSRWRGLWLCYFLNITFWLNLHHQKKFKCGTPLVHV